ncbi:MAG: ribonuclease H family protein [Bacteroides sp.]|nr:ribonuclease H family protein [Bacteroides sp.]
MSKQKFYVVWEGNIPGIYTSWADCQKQTQGIEGAKYKDFPTREEAERAYASNPYEYIGQNAPKKKAAARPTSLELPAEVSPCSLAVDAACSGNPGPMEYRGVYLVTGEEIFRFGPIKGTNNIGEFLAIVHGLALIQQRGLDIPIYSDSVNAIQWVKQKKCKTKLEQTPETGKVFEMIRRAEKWLKVNSFRVPILKWDTKKWGEIPADFGRK